MASFKDVSTPEGLKHLDEYLLTRSYIDGCVIARACCCATHDLGTTEHEAVKHWSTSSLWALTGIKLRAMIWPCTRPCILHPMPRRTRMPRDGTATLRPC